MILAVAGIFLLLPLLLTVFLSGREALRIKKQWNMESVLPMLMCREIPWEYEEEMKKVQAVLTRSSLYLRIEEEGMDGEAWEKLWKEAKAAQRQKGYQQAYRSMEAAVKETEGEMLFYQSKVCEGVFHRISSGATRDGLEVFGERVSSQCGQQLGYVWGRLSERSLFFGRSVAGTAGKSVSRAGIYGGTTGKTDKYA